MTERIFARQFHAAEGAEAWRVLPEGAYAFFRTDSFAASARFVDAIGTLVREGDAPSVDIRGDGVTVLLRAFKVEGWGLVQADLDLARAISTTRPRDGASHRSGGDPEPLDHPRRDRSARDHAVLAGSARIRPPAGQSGRGSGRPARPPGAILDRADGRAARRWRGHDASGGVGAVGRGRVTRGGGPRRGWPARPSQRRGALLDAGRSGRQRGGRRDVIGARSGRLP